MVLPCLRLNTFPKYQFEEWCRLCEIKNSRHRNFLLSAKLKHLRYYLQDLGCLAECDNKQKQNNIQDLKQCQVGELLRLGFTAYLGLIANHDAGIFP